MLVLVHLMDFKFSLGPGLFNKFTGNYNTVHQRNSKCPTQVLGSGSIWNQKKMKSTESGSVTLYI